MVCIVSSKLGEVGSMLTFRIDCGVSKTLLTVTAAACMDKQLRRS